MDDPRTDARLLKDSARDAGAFGIFYDRHAREVSTYFVRRTADYALAADLTAETFAQAFASRRRYRNSGARASAWLFTIAARQLNEFFRQERVSSKYRSRLSLMSSWSGGRTAPSACRRRGAVGVAQLSAGWSGCSGDLDVYPDQPMVGARERESSH